jgi:MoxR-like ATPase
MSKQQNNLLPDSLEQWQTTLADHHYIAERSLTTAIYLAVKLNKPLFVEGEAGVGKTEIAKVLSEVLARPLIRLQCYEGLDVSSALYEWNYAQQILQIRIWEAAIRSAYGQGYIHSAISAKTTPLASRLSSGWSASVAD